MTRLLEQLSAPGSPRGPVVQRRCSCGGTLGSDGECAQCRAKRLLRQRSAAARSGHMTAVPPVVDDVVRSSGKPLDASTRAFMEARFSHDFGSVRVHTDARADASVRALDADAYTSGAHIAFARGKFEPHSPEGRRLVAHELAHVVQQGAAQTYTAGIEVDPDPRREAEAASAGERVSAGGKAGALGAVAGALQRQPAAHITRIRVNQTSPQRVTATWSDGRTDTGECSTGKGHCCFDDTAGTAEGGACSASRSNQVGNNCTPVGTFQVTAKVPRTSGGIEFWTQFHNAKSVALHDYDPLVDGTALSHGCVRLHRPFSQLIFNGSRVGRTTVVVENLARPRCTDAALIREWEGDFRDAGRIPPDGTQINPHTSRRYTRAEIARERRHISESRAEMRSALGVDDAGLDTEIAAIQGGAAAATKIPRCIPALTVEERSIPAAQTAGVIGAAAATTVSAFTRALARVRSRAAAERVVHTQGTDLWLASTAAARGGGAGTDDRRLYWTRLMLSQAIRQFNPSWAANADVLRRLQAALLKLLEDTSRGRTDVRSPAATGTKRILISGFDPFGFTSGGDIRQSNLSGAIVLALDGVPLASGTVRAQVEGVIFPVRFADFDAGAVESFFRPFLTGPNPVSLIMTVSQGGAGFELEEFAGRRRSSGAFGDNLGVRSGTTTSPVVPPGVGAGPEFIRTNVPTAMLGSMRSPLGRTTAIRGETQVVDILPGRTATRTHSSGPPAQVGRAVEGSGGGFLSNEIFYRNSLVRTQAGSTVPVIHLHTPMLPPGAADSARNAHIATARRIIEAAVPHL
jgi:pyrrolidone-carboxylate peptidase